MLVRVEAPFKPKLIVMIATHQYGLSPMKHRDNSRRPGMMWAIRTNLFKKSYNKAYLFKLKTS